MRENRRGWMAMVALLLIVALVAVPALGAAQGTKERFKWIVSDKLTILEGGSTFSSSITMDDDIDLNGNDLIIDADGDSILVEASDDLVTFTAGAATGSLEVRTGNLQVGDETPTETHNGEDFYVEGISEFDGTAYFDGAVDMDSTLDVDGLADLDDVDIDLSAALNIDGHMVDIGAGSYDTADGDNDLGVAGDVEIDGVLELDGAGDFDDDLDVDGTTDLDDVDIDLSAALNIDGHMVDIGTGSYDTADADNDLGVAGDLEVDGGAYFDGVVDMDSSLDVALTSDLKGNVSDSGGTFTIADDTLIDGAADVAQLTVQGYTTQTNELLLLEQYDGTDLFTVNGYGRTDSVFERDGLTGYDYGFTLAGYATGVAGGAKTRAMTVDLIRPAGYEIQAGDMEDVGIMVRVDTHAITTTAGTVLRGIDSEAKADNPDGTVTNLYGGSFTAKSDTGAGSVGTMVALSTNVQNNAAVDDYLVSLDARSMRQAATEPTEEYIVHVRQANTSGTGVDAGIYIESDGTGETDDFNYGIDMSAAEIDDGDIRLQNGSILDEGTDGVATFSEFFGFVEQTAEVVGAGATIVPTGTYQPITSAAGVTCDTTTCITAGTFTGQLLILVNENAADTITIDGTGGNVECKSDVVLGAQDSLTLLWNGADWICLSGYDNS